MKSVVHALLLIAAIFLASGCSDLERVDGATFVKYGEATQIIGSASTYELVGVKDDRAYIKHWTAVTLTGRSKTMQYWVPLAELPASISLALRAGRNPWIKPSTFDLRRPKPANQALEPTPTAVTFCAYAQLAPAAGVAHL
jgi:hypothetical protein